MQLYTLKIVSYRKENNSELHLMKDKLTKRLVHKFSMYVCIQMITGYMGRTYFSKSWCFKSFYSLKKSKQVQFLSPFGTIFRINFLNN